MKKTAQFLQILAMFLLPLSLFSQGPQEDKTLSPYFMVNSPDPSVDRLPLQSTSAEVNIAGVIADVVITQVYKNDGQNPLEAIYVFPSSTQAAVYGMEMQVGDRIIVAEIQEKKQARQTYETAKSEGKRTSLLEQQRPNVFQMNVANIQPGDEIKVTLRYTELLRPTAGVYEFVYPTVVGPRYTGEVSDASASHNQFMSTPYLKQGNLPPYNFGLKVYLGAGMPLQDVTCTTHEVNQVFENPSTVRVGLKPEEKTGGDRDFILRYRLAGGQIDEGLLLYEHGDENYFLLTVQPPRKPESKDIPPREYVFIVDVSGSMNGFPIDVSKKLMRNLITGLRPSDKFNVMLFASTSATLAGQSLSASEENMEKALNFIGQQQGSGGTNLLSALQRGLNLPRAEEGISRSFVVVTDGYIGVEQETFDLIRNNLDEANLFAFGIGSSVNRHLIEGMAHVGQGEPAIVTNLAEAPDAAEQFRKYIETPVLTRVKVDFGSFEAYDVEPATIPDVMAERPVIIFGKYRGEPVGKITVKGFSGKRKVKSTVDVSNAVADKRNAALRYLWARERIRLLDDYQNLRYDDEHVAAITQLGLSYNLMTAYTSFVAVDEVVVENENGELTTVKQPLPLPNGVPNSAVGFAPALEGVVLKGLETSAFSLRSLIALAALFFGLICLIVGWRKLG